MDREQKSTQIAEIKERFGRAASAILTDFQGLDVDSMTSLRDEFRKVGVEYRVVKNTLFGIAVKDEPYGEQITAHLVGNTGVEIGRASCRERVCHRV